MQFGPGLVPTFLYYFATTSLVVAIVMTKALGLDLDTGLPQQVGAVAGVIAGGLGAYFNRTITFSVPFQRQTAFLSQLEEQLNQSGYQLVTEAEGVRVYQRLNVSQWFSGKVYVQLDDKNATIAGRAAIIRRLKQALDES